MSAEVKADVGTKLSDGALPKMEALPTDLFSQITFDCRGFQDSRVAETNSSTAREELLPAAPISTLRENFDAISVRVMINGQPFDVAVPNETFNKSRNDQKAIAKEIGGRMPTRAENRAVAEYLLAQKEAGEITEKEAALLNIYRTKWVRDTEGGLDVDGVRVHASAYCYYDGCPSYGALVVCSSAESK